MEAKHCVIKLERMEKIRIACSATSDDKTKLECKLIQTNVNAFTLTVKRKFWEDNQHEDLNNEMNTYFICAQAYGPIF